jgi:hypothetical protein
MKYANDVSAARANSRKDSRVTHALFQFTSSSHPGKPSHAVRQYCIAKPSMSKQYAIIAEHPAPVKGSSEAG